MDYNTTNAVFCIWLFISNIYNTSIGQQCKFTPQLFFFFGGLHLKKEIHDQSQDIGTLSLVLEFEHHGCHSHTLFIIKEDYFKLIHISSVLIVCQI